MEFIIGLCQTECVRPFAVVKVPLKIFGDVAYAIKAAVDWCNNQRLSSSLGNVSSPSSRTSTTPRSLPPNSCAARMRPTKS